MVENLSQYLEEVNKYIELMDLTNTTTTPWFRGQEDYSWKLIPSIFRHKNLIFFERDLNRDFKLLSKNLILTNKPDSEFEWLYIMQHYGLSTRLLDWSESSLVALFFAVEKFNNKTNSRVWILSPRVYNSLILKTINTVPIDSSTFLKDYVLRSDNGDKIYREVDAKFPLAIRPTKNSARILAQRGVFTIHGKNSDCIFETIKTIDKIEDNSDVINYIDISGEHKLNILKELYQSGISHSVLFPELGGISHELLVRYKDFFKN